MDPDAFVIENITFDQDSNPVSHVSTSIPVSELGGQEFADELEKRVGTAGSTSALAQNGDEQHAYVEMSGPLNIGYVQDDWVSDEDLQPISDLV